MIAKQIDISTADGTVDALLVRPDTAETYEGALHGWMIPGGRVYHPVQSERGFEKLIELFDETLKTPVTA